MATFIALAVVIAAITFAVLLRPLWRGAPQTTAVLGVALVLSAIALYGLLGTPAALDPVARKAPDTLQDAVVQLEAELQRDPRQVEGWRLLGRAYASGQQAVKSRDAYLQAARLAPEQPDVLVEAAEASALADPQRRFDGAAVAKLEHALQVQPNHQRARWFLGIAQRQAGRSAEAAKTWEPLLAQVDAKTAEPLRVQIDAARHDAGLAPLPAVAPAQAMPGLDVRVRLDPELDARIRLHRDASVFVIARAPGGPPMPIAVEKHAVAELPFTATLDDADGPMPTRKLSAMQEVEVIARLSMGGNAIPQPGDIESAPVRVRLPASGPIELNIAKTRQ